MGPVQPPCPDVGQNKPADAGPASDPASDRLRDGVAIPRGWLDVGDERHRSRRVGLLA